LDTSETLFYQVLELAKEVPGEEIRAVRDIEEWLTRIERKRFCGNVEKASPAIVRK
jgi:hypothetical protein